MDFERLCDRFTHRPYGIINAHEMGITTISPIRGTYRVACCSRCLLRIRCCVSGSACSNRKRTFEGALLAIIDADSATMDDGPPDEPFLAKALMSECLLITAAPVPLGGACSVGASSYGRLNSSLYRRTALVWSEASARAAYES